jgi:hypothetical protein
MSPLLQSFLTKILIEMDCEHQTLVLDQAITPDFVLLERVRRAERNEKHQTEAFVIHRYVHRHHSQPILRSNQWSCPHKASKNWSRWDSGTASSGFGGNNSDSQLKFPLRTYDGTTNYHPNARADRGSVSRYHSDTLASPRRFKEKVSLDSVTQHMHDQLREKKTSIKCTKFAQPQFLRTVSTPDMEMTWRRTGPSVRRRPSRNSVTKKRPLTTRQEMEIIWERQYPVVVRSNEKTGDSDVTPSTKTVDASCDNEATTTTIGPCSFWLSCTRKSALQLFEAALFLVCDSFPSKVVKPSVDGFHNNFHCCMPSFTILDLCGGDIAPACRILEYDMTSL